jgi:hypothetical protein
MSDHTQNWAWILMLALFSAFAACAEMNYNSGGDVHKQGMFLYSVPEDW